MLKLSFLSVIYARHKIEAFAARLLLETEHYKEITMLYIYDAQKQGEIHVRSCYGIN